ncbi:MAG TPA: OpgC domain-containing protein [Acetobacteraceae bacterium]
MNVPARPPRDQRLDVVRGWLQLTIFSSHVAGSFIGGWMIHGSWGLSDSSELFVFLSGFTLGSVFARKAARGGWREGAADILGRAWRLYRIHLTVFFLFGMMVVAAGATFLPGEARRLGWGFLLDQPQRAVWGVIAMLYQPAFMGILPVFVWCMLLLPGFAWLEARFNSWALAVPLGLYGTVWAFGLQAPSMAPEGGIAFNPFAWQILFMLGAWLGRGALLVGRALPFDAPWAGAATGCAAIMLLTGLLLRLSWYGFAPWPAPVPEVAWMVGKEDLAPPRLLHAMALAWLVARFVRSDAVWMHGWLAANIARIGRNSLEVFCLGLFLSWAGSTMLRLWPDRAWLDPVIISAGGAMLAAFAFWLERRRVRARMAVPA